MKREVNIRLKYFDIDSISHQDHVFGIYHGDIAYWHVSGNFDFSRDNITVPFLQHANGKLHIKRVDVYLVDAMGNTVATTNRFDKECDRRISMQALRKILNSYNIGKPILKCNVNYKYKEWGKNLVEQAGEPIEYHIEPILNSNKLVRVSF